MTEQMTNDKLLSTIESLNPPGGPWGLVGLFDQIEISEGAITKARRQYPEHDVALWNAFALLKPSAPLYEAPEPVYRAHCHEILKRVVKGLDTTLGTKAEIMMVLSNVSLAHPLPHGKAVLYARLFRETLPNTPVTEDVAQLATFAHDSEIERELVYMALAARVPDRKPKKESEWHTPPGGKQ